MTRPSRLPPLRSDRFENDPRHWVNVLADVPLFAELNARHLRKIAALGRVRRFHEDATIIRVGERGDAMHVILDGSVMVRPRGRASLTLGVGDFIGELALLDDGLRSATVVADTPVVVLTITRPRFEKLLRTEPPIAIAVARELARRLRTAREG